MRGTLRTLQLVQWTMLGSIFLCALVGELLRSRARTTDPSLSYIFTTAGVALVGVIFVVRRTLVFRPAESLAAHPDDEVSLSQWKSGYVSTYVLCETLASFGLILRFLGNSFQQSLPYYLGGLALLLFFAPKSPISD